MERPQNPKTPKPQNPFVEKKFEIFFDNNLVFVLDFRNV